jgi:ParB family chromosome partitioning protein
MSSANPRSRKRFTVDALFADTRPRAAGTQDLADAKLIDVSRIHPDPAQPRRTFDPERLEELAASIRLEGILQPIAVRFDAENDRYVIVHGERRWRAARLAGLTSLPAIIRDVPVERRLVQQLMENVLRDDLNAVDRASALRALRSQLGDPPWEVVAEAVGIKRSRLFQLLGTGKLSPAAQEDIQAGRLSEKQSRALQGLPPVKQAALRELIVNEGLSAPAAMRLARAWRAEPDIETDGIDAARDSLAAVRAFVFAIDQAGVARQTTAMLEAIRQASAGSDRERKRLRELASTVDSGTFRQERFHQQVNALVKSLASLPLDDAPESDVIAILGELHAALGDLLRTARRNGDT